MCQPEIPAQQRHPALLCILPLSVVPISAKRLHRHYTGQQALLSGHYRGTTTESTSNFTGTILDSRHYSIGTTEEPLLKVLLTSQALYWTTGTTQSALQRDHYRKYFYRGILLPRDGCTPTHQTSNIKRTRPSPFHRTVVPSTTYDQRRITPPPRARSQR